MSYDRLMVVPFENPKNGQVIAKIGHQLCFFEKGEEPPVGRPVEVMITRPLFQRNVNGFFDQTKVFALLLRPVTHDFVLVSHGGFEGDGRNRPTAKAVIDGKIATLVDGRTRVSYFERDSVWGDAGKMRPGKVWIRRTDNHGPYVVEGLARIEDAAYAEFMNTAAIVAAHSLFKQVEHIA